MKRKKVIKPLILTSMVLLAAPKLSYGDGIYRIFEDLSAFTDQVLLEASQVESFESSVSGGLIVPDLEKITSPQFLLINKLLNEQLGKPYVYGASGPDAFDCSGLIHYVYGLAGKTVPRTSSLQGQGGVHVEKENLRFGDLVFFDTRNTSNPQDIVIDKDDILGLFLEEEENDDSHMEEEFKTSVITHSGIYIGDGNFVHASSGSVMKVVVEKLDSKYFNERYVHAKRY